MFKTKPYSHQTAALKKCQGINNFGYFMEMGTGKSKVLIDDITILFRKRQIDFVFIIAPKGVYRNWVEIEIPKHLADDIKYEMMFWRSNPSKSYEYKLKKFFTSTYKDTLRIFVMNVESFSSYNGKRYGTRIAEVMGSKGLIAVDESTTIKNHKAKRTKTLISMSKHFKFKRILTGSPITNSPMDLFSQFQFLDSSILGVDSYYVFQHMYAKVRQTRIGSHSFTQIVGFKNLDQLTDKIQDNIFRVLKKDCLDLPDKVYTTRSIELTPVQRKLYEKIQKEALILFDNGELVTAPSIITQMLRLQQILSGFLNTDNGEQETFASNRLDELVSICEETSGKIIIWSRFRFDIIGIEKKLAATFGANTVGSFFGDTTEKQRMDLINNFQDPESPVRFFIGNPQTAGLGITLTQATTVVYYANDFNLDTRLQSEDRCHRIGQTKSVTYIDFISDKTIDEKIVKSLRNKIDISAEVLGEQAREWLTIK